MEDSINSEATQKATAQQQAKYEYEKQKVLDDAENDKLLAIEQEKKKKQQILTGATAVGLGLVIVFLIFVFNRLRVTKKQKQVIEEQKEVVELAHEELEEKNQEIMDSITYAKRIQSAILPPAKLVKKYLKESFILYKPKDVVAGDFYWMEYRDNKVMFAAADCTGHGVPGAMISVICNNGLNRSVREYGLTDPGKILDKTRELVIQEFEKSEEEVKDGMDIALCSLEGNILKYAGAHNPLWIIRKGEIIETKANKQPIGQFDNKQAYTSHSFDLEIGDSLYLFSDGYVDQFGGEKGKKLKPRAFRELLLSVQDKSMEEQKIIIDDFFETWKGSLEQIDDVCVIGVRV
jgi:serine phosphatase RsbU (regulator of sigma subunit)